jgi:hypothetical protein
MLSSSMRRTVVRSVSAVTTSIGRFGPNRDAARSGRGALEARSDDGLAAASRGSLLVTDVVLAEAVWTLKSAVVKACASCRQSRCSDLA